MVIDYSKFRREHTIECIMNAIQAARLRQTSIGPKDSGHLQQMLQIRPPSEKFEFAFEPDHLDRVNRHSDDLTLCSQDIDNLSPELDLDDVWRIQEACNRLKKLASDLDHHDHHTTNDSTIAGCQDIGPDVNGSKQIESTSKSNSIPSQISSSISSTSFSSLISPLTDSSRIDSLKEKLYASLHRRQFDSICLFGATNDDIRHLISRFPVESQNHITRVQLRNCFITNNQLQFIYMAFKNITELELILCNSLTNKLPTHGLDNIKKFTIQDCINISDEFAENILKLMPKLESLNVHAYHLSDFFPEYIGSQCDSNNLKHLAFPNCKDITNRTLTSIVRYFGSLEALCIAGTRVSVTIKYHMNYRNF